MGRQSLTLKWTAIGGDALLEIPGSITWIAGFKAIVARCNFSCSLSCSDVLDKL